MSAHSAAAVRISSRGPKASRFGTHRRAGSGPRPRHGTYSRCGSPAAARIHQRLPVPQPYIVDSRLVGLECLESKVLFGGKRLRRDLMEIVRLLGQRDVALDVGLLQLQLVRFDEEVLE